MNKSEYIDIQKSNKAVESLQVLFNSKDYIKDFLKTSLDLDYISPIMGIKDDAILLYFRAKKDGVQPWQIFGKYGNEKIIQCLEFVLKQVPSEEGIKIVVDDSAVLGDFYIKFFLTD